MDYSGIAKDVLAVLPSDPTDQLDLAHRISNLAFNSKVSPFAVGVARPSSQLGGRWAGFTLLGQANHVGSGLRQTIVMQWTARCVSHG
jgi:hypothetical protein